jgi:hypothetical protein
VTDRYVNPPRDETFLIASGSATSSDMQLALTKAQTVALWLSDGVRVRRDSTSRPPR